jgi:glycosyltransferase involved in cell wall biosynthesis
MSRKVRVLHVIQNLNYGGMERVLSDIAFRCDRDRFETHVLCLQYLGRFSEGLDKVATLHVAQPMSRVSMLWPRTLAKQMESIAPEVVHSHSGVWYKATFAARLAGVRRVLHTEHGRAKPDPLRSRIVDRIGAARSDVVVAVSSALAVQLQSDLRIPNGKIVVIPNGIDSETYRPRADTGVLRRQLGLRPETPIIGSIGRLEPIKGYDVMIEALDVLRRRGNQRDAVLVVGGEGSARQSLEQLIRSRGLQDSVFLLGWRDDVFDLQSAFTLFTLASRSEGTSISLLEAMSAGLKPVVTDVGGNSAVLGPDLRHCLVPTEQPEALATAWENALTDRDRTERDRVAGRLRVINDFGLDAMVRAYERLYVGDEAETSTDLAGNAVRGVPPSPRSSAECPPVM